MIKAIFVMREDLEISAPKLAIQIGHGNDFIHLANSRDLAVVNWHQQHNPFYVRWITECNRRKIVVRAKIEAKLKKIAKIADEN